MSQHTESTILPWNHLEEQETLISSPSFGTRRNARVTALQVLYEVCLLYTSPSPRDKRQSRMPSSA